MMGIIWDFLMILKSASRSGQKASKTIGYSDGCANVRIHGAKQGTAGGWLVAGWLRLRAEAVRFMPVPVAAHTAQRFHGILPRAIGGSVGEASSADNATITVNKYNVNNCRGGPKKNVPKKPRGPFG